MFTILEGIKLNKLQINVYYIRRNQTKQVTDQ